MKRYDEQIISMLLDKYERSLLYEGKNQRNMSISVKIQRETFPEYFDVSAMRYQVMHEQLMQMESQGLLRLVWKGKKVGHILERCELVIEHAEQAYMLLHRKPRHAKQKEILEICDAYRGKASVLDGFLDWVKRRIASNERVQKYVNMDSPEDFERLCELIWRILSNETECFLRQFSVKYFHDSKIVEKDVDKAARIIMEFTADEHLRGLLPEELLQEYSIYRNPSWLMMKGNAAFQKRSEAGDISVDLAMLSGGLGVSNQDIDSIVWDGQRKVRNVLTIENLTSFHQRRISEEESILCIYLGGYHNRMKRRFLHGVYEAYPDAEYHHFGDIDCGGFQIWKDLCMKTGIPFRTQEMDQKTYEHYKPWGRKLTDTDRKTLNSMMQDPFFADQKSLFECMLKDGIKIEQESIE